MWDKAAGTLACALRLTFRMTFQFPTLKFLRAGIACMALLLATRAHAAETKVLEGLSSEEQAAMGLTKLSQAQVTYLDGLIAHDARLAEEGGVTGFSSTFLARRTPAERSAAGVGQLTESERAALDSQAARAIAIGPPPDQPFTYSPPVKAAPPPPPPTQTMVSTPLRGEVHGDLSMTVGGGSHGSSFYGTSMDLNYTDPSGKFTIGVGVSEFHGKGFLPFCGPFSAYGPYAGYGPIGPAYAGPPYWDW